MEIQKYIFALVDYAIERELIEPEDRRFVINRVRACLELDSISDAQPIRDISLEDILKALLDYAVEKGICGEDNVSRDLYDTRLMGALTPSPAEVRRKFSQLYEVDPIKATDWYYRLAQDTDYIRSYRVKKDLRWYTDTEYGSLHMSINLSKPEKDPKAIAAARLAPASDYPKCQLCVENEGYAGRMNHPARQNLRLIPVRLAGENWYLQYSPYVYYNEHCIVLNEKHIPMVINRDTFGKLLSFVEQFPHYFVGSNADLPIVGGSILSHEHFQGGRYSFPMEQAPVEHELVFSGFERIHAGIVKWPMSVIRLRSIEADELIELADKILQAWRSYGDPDAGIYSHTGDEPHNTITPIARRRDGDYELDLVLRNNRCTAEHPMGLFHPHSELHHIKKENIGLIEVMGLAVLPSRLKYELEDLAEAILTGTDIDEDERLAKHSDWVKELKNRYSFTAENVKEILLQETGCVFSRVLEHAGVYKRNESGKAAFLRFVDYVQSL